MTGVSSSARKPLVPNGGERAIARSYDAIAERYAEQFADELEVKELDRAMLDELATRARGHGPVADVGCGPGQAAGHLAARGLDVVGVDISPKMLEIAREAHPEVAFREGSMLALPAGRGDWAAIVALYAILHLDEAQLQRAFAEFARVLRPGGLLLVSVHVGRERRREERWWGMPAELTGYFHDPDELEELMVRAGFTIERTERRPPYPGEYPSERCYVLARRDSPAPVASPNSQG